MTDNERKLEPITYTIREASEVSGLGRTTIFSHIKEGRIKSRKVGGLTLLPAAEFRKFLLGEDS